MTGETSHSERTPIPEALVHRIARLRGTTNRDPSAVAAAAHSLGDLGIPPASQFGSFFLRFKVSAFPSFRGEELLDLAEPSPQILRATTFARDSWVLPSHYVCLTSPEGEGALLYSVSSGKVYDFDLARRDFFLRDPGPPVADDFFGFLDLVLAQV